MGCGYCQSSCQRKGPQTAARARTVQRPSVALCCLALQGLANRIVASSERNLRRALLSLEACKVQQYPFTEAQEVAAPDWEMYIQVGALSACALCA